MALLAKSNDAAPFLMYGMDLTQGKSFDATQDPFVNHEMEKYSQNIYVYGIDSAFMTEFDEYGYPILDEDSDIFPLTLLVDNTMRDNEVRLAVPTVDGGAETWSSFVYVNGDEYKVYCENDDFYNIRAEDENGETIASYTSDVDDSDTFIEDFAKRLLNRYGEINTGV